MLQQKMRPSPMIGVAQRAFASGTHLEKFNWEDPFKLDSLLTDEERAISEAARIFS